MIAPRSQGAQALLDTAERLFSQDGIARVSDRRIAEEAGNANNSAVRYHFGGREGLLRALLQRQLVDVDEMRSERHERSESLLDDVRSLVVPVTDLLARQPVPSWRARFMDLAVHDPATARLLLEMADAAPAATRIVYSVRDRLTDLPVWVVRARAGLMVKIITSTCAEVEGRMELGTTDATWPRVADFLCDAITGMLLAPVSTR